MGVSSLDRPPARRAADPPAPVVAQPASPRRTPVRGAFAIGLAVSIGLHAIGFLLVRFEFRFRAAPTQAVAPDRVTPVMEAIELVILPEGVEPAEARTETAPSTEPRVVAPPLNLPPVVAPPAATAASPAADNRSIVERLGPRPGDPRLWTGPSRATPPPTRLDEVRADLGSRIAAYNDSIRAAEDAAARMLDWTATDANGGKWGVSPGRLHLGSITLPLPVQFSTPPGRRDEVNQRMADWNAIQLQRARAGAEATIKERAKEIRARRAAADTSRSGGRD